MVKGLINGKGSPSCSPLKGSVILSISPLSEHAQVEQSCTASIAFLSHCGKANLPEGCSHHKKILICL